MAELKDIHKRQQNFTTPQWDDWSDHVVVTPEETEEYVDQVYQAYHKDKMEQWQKNYSEYLKTLVGHDSLVHTASVKSDFMSGEHTVTALYQGSNREIG